MTDTVTVRERIEEDLEPERIHGLTVTRRDDDTIYAVVATSTTWDSIDEDVDMDIPVLDLRTVVVDLEADTVRVSDNGMWVPREKGVAEGLTQVLGRTTTDLNGGVDEDEPPALKSAVSDVDPDLLLERELEVEEVVEGQATDRMANEKGIDPARDWGYGGSPPPEVYDVIDRLEEVGLESEEHLTRLVWGKKEPMDRVPRPVDELKGNYGIELLPRDSGLIAIDVDYPEAFPEDVELPDSLEVSSPHGDDTRRHVILRCDEKAEVARYLGKKAADEGEEPGLLWAVQSAEWGDLWVGDRYVVGPGSQLSEYGCDLDPYTRGEPGGCEDCEDPESGYYRVVNDAPIATVEYADIIGLLEESDGYETRDRAPEAPEPEDAVELEDNNGASLPTCDSCGAEHDSEETLKVLEVSGDERRICRGGCE